MRVLVGTTEICGLIPVFADGFRRLGCDVTTAIRSRHPFYANLNYDFDLENGGRIERVVRLIQLIAQHDVFVFLWAGSSLRWNSELPLLRWLGKRIVFALLGDDVRSSLAYQQEAASFYSPEEQSFVLSPDHQARLENDPIVGSLGRIRATEWFSDLILSVRCNSGLAVRPYNHLFLPIDLTEYNAPIPARDVPIVLHAPSVKSVKGTDWIIPVLDRLKAEGVQFELRLLRDASHLQVMQELINADVVVDQLFFPLHGKLGIEAMATGCALASSNREDYEPFPPNRPIWHIDPGNLYNQLKSLLTNRHLRIDLARKGRAYVETYHDHTKVAKKIIDALDGNERQTFDHYPRFYAERLQLPVGLELPEDLLRLTARIIQRWGLPENVDPRDMVERGLMSNDGLVSSEKIPRWNVEHSFRTACVT
jgi:hypothetical protein